MADECLADGDWCGWWLAPGAKDGSSGRLTGSARVCGCKGRDVTASGLRRRADRNHVKSNDDGGEGSDSEPRCVSDLAAPSTSC